MSFSLTPAKSVEGTPNLRLVFKKEGGRTILAESFSRMPFHVFPPFYSQNHGAAYTYIVNPTPGFLGGDRAESTIILQPGSHAFITAPSATKVLNTGPDHAEQTTHLHIADKAILEYVPPYVIPFAGARFRQKTMVEMEKTSSCLVVDWFSTGRVDRGESLAFKEYDNSTIVVCNEKPIIFDRFVLRPMDEDYSVSGLLESYTVSAFLYFIHDGSHLPKPLLPGIRGLMQDGDVIAGVSTLDASGLVARVMGRNVPSVQKVLIRVIRFIRRSVLGIEDGRILDRLLGTL
jgi:urease accessory protein